MKFSVLKFIQNKICQPFIDKKRDDSKYNNKLFSDLER